MRSEKQDDIHVKCPLIETDTNLKFLTKFANMKFTMICSSVLEFHAERRLDWPRRWVGLQNDYNTRSVGLRSLSKSQTHKHNTKKKIYVMYLKNSIVC
jgi:hypothetical protein